MSAEREPDAPLELRVELLHEEGLSVRKIAAALGLSHGKTQRLIEAAKKGRTTSVPPADTGDAAGVPPERYTPPYGGCVPGAQRYTAIRPKSKT